MNWDNQHGPPPTVVAHRTQFEDTRGPSPSVAVATALADLEDTPAYQTDFRLADTIDPDALDALVTATHNIRVTFPFQNYLVVVQGNGRVLIRRGEK